MSEFTKLFRIKLDKHILPQRIQELGYEACNRLDATSDLLAACKLALPLIAGERINNDAFPPTGDLEIFLASSIRDCEKIIEAAIAKAYTEIS